MICQCGTCRRTFDSADLVAEPRQLYDVTIIEKHCPFCGAIGYTPLKLYDKVARINDRKRTFFEKTIEGWWT